MRSKADEAVNEKKQDTKKQKNKKKNKPNIKKNPRNTDFGQFLPLFFIAFLAFLGAW